MARLEIILHKRITRQGWEFRRFKSSPQVGTGVLRESREAKRLMDSKENSFTWNVTFGDIAMMYEMVARITF